MGAAGANRRETDAHERRDQHGIHARTSLRARLGVLIAASLVVTALTAATAAPSAPSPMGAALEPTRLGATASPSTRPRTAVPGFLLDRGRYLKFDAPQAGTETAPGAINNRGQLVGSYENLDAPDPQPTGTQQPMGRMA